MVSTPSCKVSPHMQGSVTPLNAWHSSKNPGLSINPRLVPIERGNKEDVPINLSPYPLTHSSGWGTLEEGTQWGPATSVSYDRCDIVFTVNVWSTSFWSAGYFVLLRLIYLCVCVTFSLSYWVWLTSGWGKSVSIRVGVVTWNLHAWFWHSTIQSRSLWVPTYYLKVKCSEKREFSQSSDSFPLSHFLHPAPFIFCKREFL